jgi:Protein of unknown function (DUF3048) N-terminal domain/Protein of unknown function (DUF3048) C-terminal domain
MTRTRQPNHQPARHWRAVALAACLVVGASGAVTAATGGATDLSPGTSPQFAAPTATPAAPTLTPAPPSAPPSTPLAPPVAGIPDGFVAGTIDGELIPMSEAARATRHPISIMVDDQADARPQSGLSTADLVIQAPAEAGIPRYMAVYQAGDADAIGPIRSTRLYYIGWASEWNALYAHVGGAPNALSFLRSQDKRLVYNADEFHWGPQTGFMVRVRERIAPHNVYSSSALLFQLAGVLGARSTVDKPAWTFIDDTPLAARPTGGSVIVPYSYNRVVMHYDRDTNRYLRSVTGETLQVDAGNGQPVAPRNVIIQFVNVGPLSNRPGEANNLKKGRLELGYIGSGRAIVMRNGEIIQATWSKSADAKPTLFRYATGPQKGQPVGLVRGQIFIEVVSRQTNVVATPGTPAAATP